MIILTIDNKLCNLEKLPDTLEEDIRFSVLDNDDPANPDFYFNSLIFLESFSSPAAVLNIGGYEITVPLNWSIAVGCSDVGGDVEILPITSLNDRGFEAFSFNPLTSFRHTYLPIEIVNIYNDVLWYAPRIRPNQLITTPINDDEKPLCVFLGPNTNRLNEIIDIDRLL